MEFDFNINKFFPNSINILRGQNAMRLEPELRRVLDCMGEASRIAQNLRRPVTAASSFLNSNQNLYIMTDSSANNGNGAVVGMLKTGPKKLFLLDKKGNQNELNPTCVLDFYIHESCQRMGLGKILFKHFLEDEKLHVKKIAIDRPSDKFLGFLRKHYGLEHFIPQVNNFVIYDGFFDNEDVSNNKPSGSYASPSFLSNNRWNSMISVNSATDDGSLFRARGNQSAISCLYDQAHCSSPNGDLWRTNSFADVSKPTPVQNVPMHPVHHHSPLGQQTFASRDTTASKFSHHRLW